MSRKIPTRAELDRAEQSLTRIRADLASKRSELASLEMRAASQSEVGDRKTDLGPPKPFFSFRVLRSLSGWPVLRRTFRATTVRLHIAVSCTSTYLSQNFGTSRQSLGVLSPSNETWRPNSDSSSSGMQSQPSIRHGRADYSFSCAMPPGSTASFALSSYVVRTQCL